MKESKDIGLQPLAVKGFAHPKNTEGVYAAMWDGLHFLNTSIIPPGADGTWIVEEVEPAYVRHCLSHLAHGGQVAFAVSHIGHEATAQVASELFATPLPVDRAPWDGSGCGVALQLKGRLPEGKILGRDELEAIGYTVRVIFRVPEQAPKTRMELLSEYIVAVADRVARAPQTEPTKREKELCKLLS